MPASVEAMRLLMGAGADVNLQSQSGATALIWSATDLDKVRLLVDHGAKRQSGDKAGSHPHFSWRR